MITVSVVKLVLCLISVLLSGISFGLALSNLIDMYVDKSEEKSKKGRKNDSSIKKGVEIKEPVREKGRVEEQQTSKRPILTPKGIAIMCAIDSRLLPEVVGGWDDSLFNIFWDQFEQSMEKHGYLIIQIRKD